MRSLYFILIIGFCVKSFSQSHKPSVFSSAGTSTTVGNLQVSWTLGETFTQTLVGGNNMVSQGFQQVFPSLELNLLGFSSLCAGRGYFLPFSAILVKNSGNVFTAQLSNASGSFASPLSIGSLASTSSGVIPINIPGNILPGVGYRIRVVSSNPALISKDNGSNISIFASPDLSSLDPAQGAISSNILLLGSGLSNITTVKFNALTTSFKINSAHQISAVVPVGATNGNVIVINANGCSDTLYNFQVVNQVCAIPTSNPLPGTFGPPPTISLTTSTTNATIYYTTNGTLPGPENASSKIYLAPLPISVPSLTLKARAFRNGFVQSAPFSGVFSVTNVCAPVTISPGTGSYFGSTQVTLSCPTPGVTIYYSTTGNVPVPGTTFTRGYNGPFFVSNSVSLRAFATKSDFLQSPVALANLSISTLGTLPPVVFSPPSGTYSASPTLSLTCPTEGTTIYYTTNGNTPVPGTPFTQIYNGPFTQFSSGTIKAYAAKTGYTNSIVGTAVYTVTNPSIVATPVFTPMPGVCSNPCPVTITCATPGAQIWYTTTGNTPDPSSPISKLYSVPVALTKTTTLKAKAFLSGYLPSNTLTGVFSIAAARVSVSNAVSEFQEEDLVLYPNPGSGKATLSGLPAEGRVTIRIWNAEGRQIAVIHHLLDEKAVEIDLRNQASGLYHIEVLWDTFRKQLRFLKD